MTRLSQIKSNSGKRILLVDDQENYTAAISQLLIREGHEIVTVKSGEECLILLKEQHFDLLLLDYFMPGGMTGEEVVTEIRQFNPILQIILQTGYAGDYPPREMLKRLDIQGYHDKTDGPEKLLLWVDVGLKVAGAMQSEYKNSQGLRYILDATPELHKIQPLGDFFDGILWQIGGLFNAENSFSVLRPERGNEPNLPGLRPEGFIAIYGEDAGLSVRSATGWFKNQFRINECLENRKFHEALQTGQTQVGEEFTIFPLRVGELVLGVIYLGQAIVQKRELELAQIFANQMAVAIHNNRLYSLATLDPLTGVYVRGFFEQCLERELRTAYRLQQPLSLIMADLDHFKMINDTAGHLIGDQALATTGKLLQQAIRSVDFVARYGGDEFVILLPQTPLNIAEIFVKRILSLLSEQTVEGPNGPIALRASIGLSGVGFVNPEKPGFQSILPKECFETMGWSLIQRADEKLYKTKCDGGNCYQVAEIIEW